MHVFNRSFGALALVLSLAAVALPAFAVPDELDYQAYLSNAEGTPVDSDIAITFVAYTVDTGGVPQWTQTINVPVDQGLFTVALGGAAAPFPASLFDTDIYIGLFVAGEEMLPRRKLLTTAYSFKSGDSETVGGMTAASLDQSSDVGTLQGDVAGLDSRVGTLELTDITDVSGVNGLIGGGTSGAVALGIADGGVTAAKLAPDSIGSGAIIDGQVTSADIADGTISVLDMGANSIGTAQIIPESVGALQLALGAVGSPQISDGSIAAIDIGPDAVGSSELIETDGYTLGGLTVTGGTTRFQGGGDIRIEDSFSGFRWYSMDGTVQFGAILVRNSENSWQDFNNGGRYIFHSDAGGVGVGTTTTATGYEVSVPSLSVAGQTSVGLERVFASYPLSSTATCISYGNLTCYYGSGSVACPVGKRVLGGGSTGSIARWSQTGQSYPASNTTWSCSMSYDLSDVSRNCYAVCARLE